MGGPNLGHRRNESASKSKRLSAGRQKKLGLLRAFHWGVPNMGMLPDGPEGAMHFPQGHKKNAPGAWLGSWACAQRTGIRFQGHRWVRSVADSNRRTRFCRPLPSHSANRPCTLNEHAAWRTANLGNSAARRSSYSAFLEACCPKTGLPPFSMLWLSSSTKVRATSPCKGGCILVTRTLQ